ncbi:MAG: polysaccharide deacetylase family protein, partial [Deltaproteobacteria bacterium]|nr:polysaccharide deacetylase family protein [Deltaproteobacteria bacterium]
MLNALTIDIEDYFMVSAFSEVVSFGDWKSYESRVERATA